MKTNNCPNINQTEKIPSETSEFSPSKARSLDEYGDSFAVSDKLDIIDITNYEKNFSMHLAKIKNNQNLLEKIQKLYENIMRNINKKYKILGICEIEKVYTNLLKKIENYSKLKKFFEFVNKNSKFIKIINFSRKKGEKEPNLRRRLTKNENLLFIWIVISYSVLKNLDINRFVKEHLINL